MLLKGCKRLKNSYTAKSKKISVLVSEAACGSAMGERGLLGTFPS